MNSKLRYTVSALMWAVIFIAAYAVLAQTPSGTKKNNNDSDSKQSITPAALPSLPVAGSGTLGRLAKWTGFNTSNSFLGDSTIFESKDGLVGVGTTTPTSPLT